MSKKIPDFTDSQIWTVDSSLAERFKEKTDGQHGDNEICPHTRDRERTTVTGLYREAEDLSRCYVFSQTAYVTGNQKAKALINTFI